MTREQDYGMAHGAMPQDQYGHQGMGPQGMGSQGMGPQGMEQGRMHAHPHAHAYAHDHRHGHNPNQGYGYGPVYGYGQGPRPADHHGGFGAHYPHPQAGASSWFDFRNESFVKGLLVGAAATFLLTNEGIQKGTIKSLVQVWSMMQGGVEEVKERFRDAEAEIQAERSGE